MDLIKALGKSGVRDQRLEGWFAVERELRALIDRRLEPCGITCAELMTLRFISHPNRLGNNNESAPASVSEMTRYFGLATRTVVVTVGQLEKKGLVTKARSMLDSRQHDLTLSSAGKETLLRAEVIYKRCAAVFEDLPKTQWDALWNILPSVLRHVERENRRDIARAKASNP